MNSRTDALFLEALHIPAGAERDAFLDEACGDDVQMRRRLDAALRDDSAADAFFEGPDTIATPTSCPRIPGEQPGEMIGRYKLLQIIGEGGFGTVWMAEQSEPVQRRVALKIIRIGMDTREFVARFEQERQALAMMDHPSIARVLDGGATPSGRPYFVMELVRGVPITKFCDEAKLPLAARLQLFVEVCHAIQHAHQKGVIHRDIKPSNVMVTLDGVRPVPKVIDFGIAKATQGKLTDKTLFTRFEQFVGTPVYMSPEQAGLGGLDVDTRCDVYALGILLYELLTGKPPFDAKSLASAGYEEMRRIIREVEPSKPSSKLSTIAGSERTSLALARDIEPGKLNRLVEPDLDWIVMMAIDKDRSRRYETVNGLARDIQRFLADEPVSATPPSAVYKFRKFARRNKTAFRVAAGIAAMLVAATIVSSWQAVRATRAENRATQKTADEKLAREEAEDISDFLGGVFQSPDPWRDGLTVTVAETLTKAKKKLETELAGQPGRRAKFQAALGRTYFALGLYSDAITLQEAVRDYYHKNFGLEHADTIKAMNNLAISYHDSGNTKEALKMREDVLPLSRKVNGGEHPATLSAMTNLASSYDDAGSQNKALELEEEVLRLRQKVSGPEHPETLRAMSNLANTYFNAGRLEALTLRKEVLSLSLKSLRPKHPDILRAMQNLAISFAPAGSRDEALKLRTEVLSLCGEVFGKDHLETIGAMGCLASSLEDTGHPDKALKMREEVVTLYKKRNPEHPETLGAMHNLAISYRNARRLDDAITLQKEVLELRLKVDHEEHPDTLAAMHSMANFYYEKGRREEALTMREKVVKLSQESEALGEKHRNTIAAMHNLAISYFDAERWKEALEMRVEVLRLSRTVNGLDHPDTIKATQNMAESYTQAGLSGKAEALRKELADKGSPSPSAPAPALETQIIAMPNPRPRQPSDPGTLVAPDSEWKWLHPTDGKDPAEKVRDFHTSFFLADFDDSAWETGKDNADPDGGFGFGDAFIKGVNIGKPDADVKDRDTAYFRHEFNTKNKHENFEFSCRRDDGIIVYLDGIEVFRDNVASGADSWQLASLTPMDRDNNRVIHRTAFSKVLPPGDHILAISVHNTFRRSTDLGLGGVTLIEVEAPKQ